MSMKPGAANVLSSTGTIQNAGGNLADATGLVSAGVFTSIGISGSVGNQNFSSTTPANISGTEVSFNLSRATNIMIQGFVTGKVSAGTNNGLFNIVLLGLSGTSNGNCYVGVTSYITLFSYLRVLGALPGQYTAVFQGSVDAGGTTFNVPGNSTVLEAFKFGS